MNHIDFGQKGGFPLTQDTLGWMQKSYSDVISGLAGLCGNNVIVSGCKPLPSGGVEAGWLSVKNKSGIPELVYMPSINAPFTHVLIKDVCEERTAFKEGDFSVYFKREAQALSNPVGDGNAVIIEWSSFSRIFSDNSDFGVRCEGLIKTLNYLHEEAQASRTHASLKNNPHSVTAAQVGLDKLPNAKSDSITLPDSNTLATSKAVYDLKEESMKRYINVLWRDSVCLGILNNNTVNKFISNSDNKAFLAYKNGLDYCLNIYFVSGGALSWPGLTSKNYTVLGTFRVEDYSKEEYNACNDAFYTIGKRSNFTFDLLIRAMGAVSKKLYFDYVVI